MTPVYWNVLFVSLNVFWVTRLLLERRPVQLTADEQHLCDLVFRLVSPREMINLLKIGQWESAAINECIVPIGDKLDCLMLIHSGRVCYVVNGEKTQVFGPGQFMGSISFVTDETAPADFLVLEPTRYVSWKKSSLKKYLSNNPELHAAIQATLGIDLSKKLTASWMQSQTSG